MSKHSYTSVHDLKDIFLGVYNDCGDYKVKIWNFTDQQYMNLAFRGVKILSDGKMLLVLDAAREDDSYTFFTDVDAWKTALKLFDRHTQEWEDAEVIVWNKYNKRSMHITFTGSSNDPKEVHYTINYDDPRYRKWKRDLFWFKFNLIYKFKKLFHIK